MSNFCINSYHKYSLHTKGLDSAHRDRPISMVLVQVFRDSERDAGG